MNFDRILKSPLIVTKHGQARMQQRSTSMDDVQVIRHFGTSFGDDTIVLMRKDVNRELESIRRNVKLVERQINQAQQRCCETLAKLNAEVLRKKLKQHRKLMNTLKRLQNRKIVFDGNTLITCYPCTRNELKRISKTYH
jgi:hypothetical protein